MSDASRSAVSALEDALVLPAGSLGRLVHRLPPADPQQPLAERRGPVSQLLDALPGSRERTVDVLSHHVTYEIDASRRLARSRVCMVVRARRDGVDRHFIRRFGEDDEIGDAAPVPQAVKHCHVGRVVHHPSSPVMVAELLFGVSLRAGATWTMQWEVLSFATIECTAVDYAFRLPVRLLVMEVDFTAVVPSSACRAYTSTNLDKPKSEGTALAMSPERSVHLCLVDRRSGLAGVSWRW